MISLIPTSPVCTLILFLASVLQLHVSVISTSKDRRHPPDVVPSQGYSSEGWTNHNWTSGRGHSPYEWIWMSGPNIGDQHSMLSDSDTSQYPGSRTASASWRDTEGNVWMFGGFGHDAKPTRNAHILKDLWLWNATTGVWHLVKQKLSDREKVRVLPQARHHAAACGVTGVMFILFGGMGPQGKPLYDTWIFDIKSSRWLPLYIHTSRVRDMMSHPPARSHAAVWCNMVSLVVFSGHGGHSQGLLGDMWMLSLRNLTWVQLVGRSQIDSGDYRMPLSRVGATTWTGTDGSLLLFGGNMNPRQIHNHPFHEAAHLVDTTDLLADLWFFSIHSTSWTRLHTGLPPRQKADSVVEFPGQRHFSSSWRDDNDNLWLFGGIGLRDVFAVGKRSEVLSDVWMYDVTRKDWMCKARGTSPGGVYSRKGQRQDMSPTGRSGSTVWQYDDIVYIAGGFGYDGRRKIAYLNDMWLYLHANNSTPLYVHDEKDLMKHHNLSGGAVFAISLSTFGGAVLIMGLYCFVKNFGNLPNFRRSTGYNVRYSPLFDEAHVDT